MPLIRCLVHSQSVHNRTSILWLGWWHYDHRVVFHIAFSASFSSTYKAQCTGVLRSTWPNHCWKFAFWLCGLSKPLCYEACQIHAIVPVLLPFWKFWFTPAGLAQIPHRHFTRHNGLHPTNSIIQKVTNNWGLL